MDCVRPVGTERSQVDSAAQSGDLIGCHANPEIRKGHIQAFTPGFLEEELGAVRNKPTQCDILGASHVPHNPGNGVDPLDRTTTNLLIGDLGEERFRHIRVYRLVPK
jgi:hypothetical protein